jgi:hypothetical protein
MADRHLSAALARLRQEESDLCTMIAGLCPDKAKAWRKQVECLCPAFTLEEALARNRKWIKILQDEANARELNKWPELAK